jgi:trans-aconitate methyltransferase
MDYLDRKKHWENIYQTKDLKDVSWYEPNPTTSLNFFKQFKVAKDAKIIDIGGGDSFLVDHLLGLGYTDITVLDISALSLEKSKQRLGYHAKKVKWIVADAATFKPSVQYDFWHDRAAFHFLTQEHEISNYINTIQKSITPTGVLVIGTFSEQGPKKCSGIEIKQYSETTMTNRLKKFFEKIKCITVDHKTPFNTIQNFIFCSFKKNGTSIA